MDHNEYLNEIKAFFNAYPISSPVRGHAQYLLGRLEAAERTAKNTIQALEKCNDKQKALGKLLSESFPTGR